MSNAIYKKDLHDVALAVAQGSKDYTDKEVKKAKDELITFFSRNTVDTDDHTNELAYQITAPSGAKLLQLMSVGGNTVKLSPSVASDSTKAMIKTMPSTVYTFDGSKFEGDSLKSENLAYIKNKSQTHSDIAYVASETQQTLTLNGTSSAGSYQNFEMNIIPSGTYYVSVLLSGTASASCNLYLMDESNIGTLIGRTDAPLTNQQVTFTTNQKYLRINVASADIVFTNLTIRIMVSKTSITEYKKGFEGIHNLELSGLKVEGENKLDVSSTTFVNGKGLNSSGVEYNNANMKSSEFIDISSMLESGETYYLWINTGNTSGLRIWQYASDNSTIEQNSNSSASATYIAFTVNANTKYIRFSSNLNENNLGIYKVLPTSYVPYIQPTALPIDLSSILYNGSPLFEGNSLKGVGTAKDYITPYVAHKGVGAIQIKDCDITNDASNQRFMLNVPSLLFGATRTIQVLCVGYECLSNAEGFYIDWNMVIYNGGSQENPQVIIHNHNYSTIEAFKNAEGDKYIVFPLATPIEVSIDWSSTLRNIQGYSNGSIIVENTNNMDVESVITYNSIIQETLCPSITITRNGVDILTRNLPTQASDGYSAGTQRNYRVFCDDEGNAVNKRYTNVDKNSNLGGLDWQYITDGTYPIFLANISGCKSGVAETMPNIMNIKYETMLTKYGATFKSNNYNNKCTIRAGASDIMLQDTSYTDATTFKTAMTNEPLYYELNDASKTETDMDDFDYFFDVEEGDVITFNNTYAQQVYATYSFLIKEAKSNE